MTERKEKEKGVFDITRIKTIVLLNDLRRSVVFKSPTCLLCDPVSFVHREVSWEIIVAELMRREEVLLGIPSKGK